MKILLEVFEQKQNYILIFPQYALTSLKTGCINCNLRDGLPTRWLPLLLRFNDCCELVSETDSFSWPFHVIHYLLSDDISIHSCIVLYASYVVNGLRNCLQFSPSVTTINVNNKKGQTVYIKNLAFITVKFKNIINDGKLYPYHIFITNLISLLR